MMGWFEYKQWIRLLNSSPDHLRPRAYLVECVPVLFAKYTPHWAVALSATPELKDQAQNTAQTIENRAS